VAALVRAWRPRTYVRSHAAGLSTHRIVAAAALWLGAAGSHAGERELWALWSQHLAATNAAAHVVVAESARRYEAALPADAFLPVVRSLAAWHWLQAGRTEDARAALEAALAPTHTAGPLGEAAAGMAQRWLTRLDRDRVREALRVHYAAKVRFPERLDELRGPAAPPLADRWGKPWVYRLTRFEKVRGLAAQRYILESGTLGAASDLAAALREPYAGRLRLTAERVLTADGRLAVQFRTLDAPPRDVTLTEGTAAGSVRLARVGESLLVLCDEEAWLVLRRPAGDG
jgi:hypothetical protein